MTLVCLGSFGSTQSGSLGKVLVAPTMGFV